MLDNPRTRVTVLVSAAIAATLAGFAVLPLPFQHQAAMRSAQHAFGSQKLNVLLLGYMDDEATTDTMLLGHLDVGRRTATLVSIPRDTWVRIPGHGMQKINAAYAYGGTQLSAVAVSRLMGGVPIDATIALQPVGAAQLVDALGGLNVDVDEDMNYDDDAQQLHIHLKKGRQYLTGSQVLGYIRFRHDPTSDFGRMHRQQRVLHLMLDQLSQPQNWLKLPRLLGLARKDVVTDLSTRKLLALLEVYRNVPEENVRSFTLPGKVGWAGDASVVFVDPRWAKLIGTVLFAKADPPQDRVVVSNATGNPEFDPTIVGALRGGGWNVPTFVDQPQRNRSVTVGTSAAARTLARTFATEMRAGSTTTLLIGTNLAPDDR
jgi:LCP family protein required for cell wall assembly